MADPAQTNVAWTVEGGKLLIAVDLGRSLGRSKSGKSTVIASTFGAEMLPSGEKINLNIYK